VIHEAHPPKEEKPMRRDRTKSAYTGFLRALRTKILPALDDAEELDEVIKAAKPSSDNVVDHNAAPARKEERHA
jgi:hypothetical protein